MQQTEGANMILRIDNVIAASKSKMPSGPSPSPEGGGYAAWNGHVKEEDISFTFILIYTNW